MFGCCVAVLVCSSLAALAILWAVCQVGGRNEESKS